MLEVREGFIRKGRNKEVWKCYLLPPLLPSPELCLPSVVSSCDLIRLLWTLQARQYLEVPEIWIRALCPLPMSVNKPGHNCMEISSSSTSPASK